VLIIQYLHIGIYGTTGNNSSYTFNKYGKYRGKSGTTIKPGTIDSILLNGQYAYNIIEHPPRYQNILGGTQGVVYIVRCRQYIPMLFRCRRKHTNCLLALSFHIKDKKYGPIPVHFKVGGNIQRIALGYGILYGNGIYYDPFFQSHLL